MILRRLAESLRDQNWVAIGIELAILVLGVYLGIQVSNWNEARADEALGREYSERLLADLRHDRAARQQLVDYYDAVSSSAERTVELLDDSSAPARDLVVNAYRATEYAYNPQTRATWDEIVSTGHAGLLPRAAVESGLADYFAYDAAFDVMQEFKTSLYRRRVRSLIPHQVQRAIRLRCSDVRNATYEVVGFRDDCELGVDETLLVEAAQALRQDRDVIEGLRYQFSDLAAARANIRGDVAFLDQAITALGGGRADPDPTEDRP